ncbi:MAG: hypothetical protein ABI601_02085 [bacterium]
MPALLVLAPTATKSDSDSIARMARSGAELLLAPIVAAIPAEVDAPPGIRAVRVKRDGAPITAVRLGMAQLTNTTATSVLLWPFAAADVPITTLRALMDVAALEPGALFALASLPLDLAPVIVPRDAWLELVTLGEGGLDALSARRRITRV